MVFITARSTYGLETATYSLDDGHLVLEERSSRTNLAGMALVNTFETLTVEQAKKTLDDWNNEGSGHEYDGCHLCTLRYSLTEKDE